MKPKTFRIIPALLLLASCAPHRAGPTVPVSPLPPGETISPTTSPTSEGTPVPVGPMADVYAVLDTYEPPHASPETIAALTSGIARWLAQGNDPALLPALLPRSHRPMGAGLPFRSKTAERLPSKIFAFPPSSVIMKVAEHSPRVTIQPIEIVLPGHTSPLPPTPSSLPPGRERGGGGGAAAGGGVRSAKADRRPAAQEG